MRILFFFYLGFFQSCDWGNYQYKVSKIDFLLFEEDKLEEIIDNKSLIRSNLTLDSLILYIDLSIEWGNSGFMVSRKPGINGTSDSITQNGLLVFFNDGSQSKIDSLFEIIAFDSYITKKFNANSMGMEESIDSTCYFEIIDYYENNFSDTGNLCVNDLTAIYNGYNLKSNVINTCFDIPWLFRLKEIEHGYYKNKSVKSIFLYFNFSSGKRIEKNILINE